jgi:hypothetical protein
MTYLKAALLGLAVAIVLGAAAGVRESFTAGESHSTAIRKRPVAE